MHKCGGALGNQDISYSATNQRVAAKCSSYADKYNQFIVDYVIEWDRVVTARVSAGLKTTDAYRRDLDHYQKKVEELRNQSNRTLAKGKMVDDKTQEKLQRNEEKLIKSKEIYDKAARDMCMVLEETTERGWKDLHPILVKMAQFDMTLANDESKGLAEMEAVITSLKSLASTHDLKSAGRLKELGSQEPSLLYTGSSIGTVSAITDGGDVSSEFGGLSMGSSSSNYGAGSPSLPPGTVAPQGMGGFPVQIQSNEEPLPSTFPLAPTSARYVRSAPSSGNNWTPSHLSTSEMLTLAHSAAPPPTMDQVNESFESYSNLSYSSGNPMAPAPAVPPPPPPSSGGFQGYGYSAPMAAPMTSPPALTAHPWSSAPASTMAPTLAAGYPVQNTNTTYFNTPASSNTNSFGPPSSNPGSASTNPFAY
jgi:hypothetical protein